MELDNKEYINEAQDLEEEEGHKEEVSGSQDMITIVDITKDTPIKTNILTEEEIKNQILVEAASDKFLPSTNLVLI